MKKVIALLLASALCLCALAECSAKSSSSGKSSEPVKLNVAVLAAQTALPVVDIVNNGLDKKNGLELNLISFTDGASMNEAMAAGKIDVSFIGAAGVIALANNNAKMIAELSNDTIAINLNARAGSKIVKKKGVNKDYPNIYGSKDSLKGVTVLCPAGTLSQYEVTKYLSVFGLTVNDVNFVPMDYAQAYQAFKAGQGDIIATRSPQSYTATGTDKFVQIASLTDLKSVATAQIIASENAYNTKADALATLVKLVYQDNDKLDSNVGYAANLMVKWFSKNGQTIDPTVAKRQLSTKPFYKTSDVKTRNYGQDFKTTIVGFEISSGQLDPSLKDKVYSNITDSILVKAGLKK
jgi:sulfonate transport system substrate-binding protein